MAAEILPRSLPCALLRPSQIRRAEDPPARDCAALSPAARAPASRARATPGKGIRDSAVVRVRRFGTADEGRGVRAFPRRALSSCGEPCPPPIYSDETWNVENLSAFG